MAVPVARSYENMEIKGEPYEKNGKMWVVVVSPCKRCGGSGHYSMNAMGDSTCYRCGGSGKERMEVRWYTEAQRATMDRAAEKRAAAKEIKREERRIKWAERNAMGFGDAGYITVFKGDKDVLNNWAHETSPCRIRYNTIFGWFCPSTLTYDGLPDSITPIKLTWEEVRDTNDPENLLMKAHDEVNAYVQALTNDPSTSEYQGEVGAWLEKDIIVKKKVEVDGRYGGSLIHIMEDDDGNVYIWSTSAKSLDVDRQYHLRMKVKDHQLYNGVKQTVVYYCKEK